MTPSVGRFYDAYKKILNVPLLLGNRTISKKFWENVNIFVLRRFNDFCVISVCGLMEKSYYSVVFISVFGRWHKNQSCGFTFTHSVFPFVKLIVNSILGIKLKKKKLKILPQCEHLYLIEF